MASFEQRAADGAGAGPRGDVPPPIPAFSLLGSLSPLLLVPIVLVAMLAIFAPQTVLDEYAFASSFTEWMRSHLPLINEHAASTAYPQVALLVHCTTLALIPALAAVWLVQSFVNYPRLLARNRATGQPDLATHLLILFVAPPLFLGAVFIMVALPGDVSWAQGLTTGRRGGLAFMNALMLYLSSMAVGSWPFMVRLFVDLRLRKWHER